MSLLPDKYDTYVKFFRFTHKYWNTDIFSDEENKLRTFTTTEETDWEHSPEELVGRFKGDGTYLYKARTIAIYTTRYASSTLLRRLGKLTR